MLLFHHRLAVAEKLLRKELVGKYGQDAVYDVEFEGEIERLDCWVFAFSTSMEKNVFWKFAIDKETMWHLAQEEFANSIVVPRHSRTTSTENTTPRKPDGSCNEGE